MGNIVVRLSSLTLKNIKKCKEWYYYNAAC